MNKVLCSAAKSSIVAIATAVTIAAAPLAHADGLYAGVSIAGAGNGHLEERDAGTVVRHDAKRDQTRLRIFGGFDLDPQWGVEAGYHGLGGDTSFDLDGGGKLKVHTSAIYLAARRNWQMSEDWSLFAKAGLARGRLQLDLSGGGGTTGAATSKTGAYLSAGASWMLTRDMAVQLELEHMTTLRYDGLEAGMNHLSLGLRYHF